MSLCEFSGLILAIFCVVCVCVPHAMLLCCSCRSILNLPVDLLIGLGTLPLANRSLSFTPAEDNGKGAEGHRSASSVWALVLVYRDTSAVST
ncbi:hypothetical protein V8F33_006793 [Rhypophila sp. PSN 637]